MSLKLLDSYWFNNAKGAIGVALFEDGIIGNKKSYISSVDGNNQETDIQYIVAFGSSFPLSAAKELFPQHF